MVRGVVPRQPGKTGRHEGSRALPRSSQLKGTSRQAQAAKNTLPHPRSKAVAVSGKKGHGKGYNSVAPERITEILRTLDATYPEVTCALTPPKRLGTAGRDDTFCAIDGRERQ